MKACIVAFYCDGRLLESDEYRRLVTVQKRLEYHTKRFSGATVQAVITSERRHDH